MFIRLFKDTGRCVYSRRIWLFIVRRRRAREEERETIRWQQRHENTRGLTAVKYIIILILSVCMLYVLHCNLYAAQMIRVVCIILWCFKSKHKTAKYGSPMSARKQGSLERITKNCLAYFRAFHKDENAGLYAVWK